MHKWLALSIKQFIVISFVLTCFLSLPGLAWATAPTVTNVDPAEGSVEGGALLTIDGSNFETSGAYSAYSVVPTSGNITPTKILIDSSGNTYITGPFDGTTTIGSDTLVSAGSNDVLIAKFDSSGNPVWARRGGGTGNDSSSDMVMDSSGNLYIVGSFAGTATFGAQPALVSAGSNDTFLVKYDSNGNVTMAVRGGGTGTDSAQAVIVDSSGSIYITGFFTGTATFAGQAAIVSAGTQDVFIVKYNSSGSATMAIRGGGTATDTGSKMLVDSSGNIYVVGTFNGTATFGALPSLVSAGVADIFLVKYNSSGTAIWAQQGGGTGSESVNRLVFDNSGNLAFVGVFNGTASFGSFNIVSAGAGDMYVAKYDTSGTVINAWGFGGTGSDSLGDILFDSDGNFYIVGTYTSPATFGSFSVSGTGFESVLLKVDSSGNVIWVESGGGTGTDLGRSIVRDSDGNIILVMTYVGTATFDASTTTNFASQAAAIVRYSEEIEVTIGASECADVTYVSSSQITCTTRAGEAGFQTLTVYNPSNESGTWSTSFKYNLPGSATAATSAPVPPGVCTYFPPIGWPDLFQVQTTGTTATLWFTPVGHDHDHYLITYGPKEDPERFSQFLSYHNYDGVIKALIQDLQPNTMYFFKVRGGNNCAAGSWSNDFPAKTMRKPMTYFRYNKKST